MPQEIFADTKETLREFAHVYSTVTKWCAELKGGRSSCEDSHRCGQPSTVVSEETDENIIKLVINNWRLSIDHMTSKHVTYPPPRRFRAVISTRSQCILGFWRNCTDRLCWTWHQRNRKLLRWSDWKMSSGTEREETRIIVSLCAVSPTDTWSQASPSAILTASSSTIFARPARPQSLLSVTKTKDTDLLTIRMLSTLQVAVWRTKIKNSSTMEKSWTKCIPVGGDYVEKCQNNKCNAYSLVNCVKLSTHKCGSELSIRRAYMYYIVNQRFTSFILFVRDSYHT